MKNKVAAFYHVRAKLDLIDKRRETLAAATEEIDTALKRLCEAGETINKTCAENELPGVSHLLRGMVNELESRKHSLRRRIKGYKTGRKRLQKQLSNLSECMGSK